MERPAVRDVRYDEDNSFLNYEVKGKLTFGRGVVQKRMRAWG